MTLTIVDFFCGAGGSSTGAALVPGVELVVAANHWDRATPAGGTWRERATSTDEPIPARTTRETDGVAVGAPGIDLDDFPDGYWMAGNRREQVRLAGNAVTPPAARDLVSLVAESLGAA